MISPAQLDQVWEFGELPFHVGAMAQPSNGSLPDRLPFRLAVDARSGLLVQMPDEAVEEALERAYRAGSAIGTPLADSGLGARCRDDFLGFIARAAARERLDETAVLEIGSGGGALLRALHRRGAAVTGVEPGAEADPDAPFRVLAEPFRRELFDERFDLIVHYGVTEHVGDPVGYMADQLSLLRPGGLIVFSVPDCEVPLAHGDISILVHEHWSYFTEATLAALAVQAGARVVEVEHAGVAGARYSAWAHGDVPRVPGTVGSPTEFAPRATANLARLEAFTERLRGAGSTLGIYCPGRFINYEALLGGRLPPLRYYDDDPLLHGRFYPPSTVPVRSRDELLGDPPTHLLIVSWTFGAEIAAQLRSESRLQDVEIMTIADLLKS